jgi:hypothetical protein
MPELTDRVQLSQLTDVELEAWATHYEIKDYEGISLRQQLAAKVYTFLLEDEDDDESMYDDDDGSGDEGEDDEAQDEVESVAVYLMGDS